jgi:hypothetical protein
MSESKIYIENCMPMVADVVSGMIPKPRERAEGEPWEKWIVDTPAYRKLALNVKNLEPATDADLADFLGDQGALCVNDLTTGNIIALNSDGTRAAIREDAGWKIFMGGRRSKKATADGDALDG